MIERDTRWGGQGWPEWGGAGLERGGAVHGRAGLGRAG